MDDGAGAKNDGAPSSYRGSTRSNLKIPLRFSSSSSTSNREAPLILKEEEKKKKEMALFARGEPLVAKLAALAKYVVLPGAMAAAVVYSPPDYSSSSGKHSKSPK